MKLRFKTNQLNRVYRIDEQLPIEVPTEPVVVTIVDTLRPVRSYFVRTSDRMVIGTAGRPVPAG